MVAEEAGDAVRFSDSVVAEGIAELEDSGADFIPGDGRGADFCGFDYGGGGGGDGEVCWVEEVLGKIEARACEEIWSGE